jgi:hypothetical protein
VSLPPPEIFLIDFGERDARGNYSTASRPEQRPAAASAWTAGDDWLMLK